MLFFDYPRCKHTRYFAEKLTLHVTANPKNKQNGNPGASPEEFFRLKIFIQLFERFNKRYDQMNDELNKIIAKSELDVNDRIKLYDYFNLCGEEYLYYSRGYIFDEVWEAWQNGMKYILRNEQVYKLWKEEEETKSYYGLKISI